MWLNIFFTKNLFIYNNTLKFSTLFHILIHKKPAVYAKNFKAYMGIYWT